MMTRRTYSELISIPTFAERYEYLRLTQGIGIATFGNDRYINQRFYTSREWKQIRQAVIARDNACDLAFPGMDLLGGIHIHHMNPISLDDLDNHTDLLFDLEYLICTSHQTHNAIHYGGKDSLIVPLIERKKGDTTLWKKVF